MWTETGQLQLATGHLAAIGATTGQPGDPGSTEFAALFDQPAPGSSGEAILMVTPDAPAELGAFWAEVPQTRHPGLALAAAASPDLSEGKPGLDRLPPGSGERGLPAEAAAEGAPALSVPTLFLRPEARDKQPGAAVPTSKDGNGTAGRSAPSRGPGPDQVPPPFPLPASAASTENFPTGWTGPDHGRTDAPPGRPTAQIPATIPDLPQAAKATAGPSRPALLLSAEAATDPAEGAAAPPGGGRGDGTEHRSLPLNPARHAPGQGRMEPVGLAAAQSIGVGDDGKGDATPPLRPVPAALAPEVPAKVVQAGMDGADVRTRPVAGHAPAVVAARPDPAVTGGQIRPVEPEPPAIASGLHQAVAETAAADAESQPRDAIAGPPTLVPLPRQMPDQAPELLPAKGDIRGGPTLHPATTKAERIWLGRLHWQDVPAARAGHASGAEASATRASEGSSAGPPDRPHHGPVLPGSKASGPVGPILRWTEPVEHFLQLDSDLAPFAWSPAGQPAFAVNPMVGPLPAGAVSQLVAGITATLHHRADGMTEIALSPDELGSVRLQLEADTRDPDRLTVHLHFDRPETLDLFRRHADQLTEAIRAAGYAEAKLDFGQHGTGTRAGGEQDASEGQNTAGANPARHETDPGSPHPAQDPRFPLGLADAAGLDLRL